MGADEEIQNIYYSIYNINLTLVNVSCLMFSPEKFGTVCFKFLALKLKGKYFKIS